MIPRTMTVLLVLLYALVSPAAAADQMQTFPVKHALDSQIAKEKLLDNVSVYMYGQPHPSAKKKMRAYRSNKRTGGSDQDSCDKAFLSAVIALQERAFREGGDAVIDIYSVTGNKNHRSADTYTCNAGRAMVNVVLMGTVADLGR